MPPVRSDARPAPAGEDAKRHAAGLRRGAAGPRRGAAGPRRPARGQRPQTVDPWCWFVGLCKRALDSVLKGARPCHLRTRSEVSPEGPVLQPELGRDAPALARAKPKLAHAKPKLHDDELLVRRNRPALVCDTPSVRRVVPLLPCGEPLLPRAALAVRRDAPWLRGLLPAEGGRIGAT